MGNKLFYVRSEDQKMFHELNVEAQLYCRDKKTGKPPGIIKYMISLIREYRDIIKKYEEDNYEKDDKN